MYHHWYQKLYQLIDSGLFHYKEKLKPIYNLNISNNMPWNDTKFKELRIGGKNDYSEGLLYTTGRTQVLEPESYVKDLGVLVDCGLTYNQQRNSVITKAKNKSAWALIVFKCRTISIMRKIWKSIVQPHLDYASILWQPVSFVIEVRKMENPLRAFTQRIPSLR